MSEFFSFFPNTVYANAVCKDITRRIGLRSAVKVDARAYLPYVVRAGERIDQVAQHYYGSPDDTWMVLLSANVVDPYYDWYMEDGAFHNHIRKKYGSVANAQSYIRHWELDWSDSDEQITPAGWAALDDALKKYYEANYGNGTRIISYSRRREDWTVSTNSVVKLGLAANAEFDVGERVEIKTGVTVTGHAQIAWANSTTVQIIHVSGNTAVNNTIRQISSNVSANIASEYFVANNIPIDERTFWNPVTYYDWERGRNESKKAVKLLDAKYKTVITEELKKVMKPI